MRLVPDDRSAERAAELLLLAVGLLESFALGEVFVRGQLLVLEEHERAAVKLVRALLRHRVDDAARGEAVLGVELAA